MLRAAKAVRRFGTLNNGAEGLLCGFPNPHFAPPPEILELPKLGFWKGLYGVFQENTLDFITYFGDKGYGLGAGIVAFSLAFRSVYAPFILYTQICSLKMILLGPELQAIRTNTSKAYQSGKREEVMKANEAMGHLKRKHGIRSSLQYMQITQIPFLVMFFWTIQDVTYDVINYPGMQTDGFLWFQNLSEPDPYFVLPMMLACTTFMSIHKSPNTSQATGPVARFARYFKYLAFFSFPITASFPSAIVLNWFIMGFFQLCINSLVYTKAGRNLVGIPDVLPDSMLAQKSQVFNIPVVKPVVFAKKPTKAKIEAIKAKEQIKDS